jgi:hypothetical protein
LLSHRSGLPYYQYEFDVKVRSKKIFPNWLLKEFPKLWLNK